MILLMLSGATLLACRFSVFGRTISPRQVADGSGLSPSTLPSFPALSGPSPDYSLVKLDIPTQSRTENTDITAYNLQPGVVAPDQSTLSPVQPEDTLQLGIDNNAPVTQNSAMVLDSAPDLRLSERLFLQARALLDQMNESGCKLVLFELSEGLTGLDFDWCEKTSDWKSLAHAVIKSKSGYVVSLLKNGKVLSLLNTCYEEIENRKGVLYANLGYWNNAVDSMFGGNNVISDAITDLPSLFRIEETYFPGPIM